MSEEAESVLQLLREISAELEAMLADVRDLKQTRATPPDLSLWRSDFDALRADIAHDFAPTRNELSAQIDSLRREVEGYRAAYLNWRRSFEASRNAPRASSNT